VLSAAPVQASSRLVVPTSWEAIAAWQWYNYLAARVPVGRTILRINLDETSICLYQGARFGNNFDPNGGAAVQNASLARRRTYMTHVAIICDAPHIQPLLPQVLICNERVFPQAQLAALRAGLPKNVHLWRQRSAWNNIAWMMMIIRLLRDALAPYVAEFMPIFLFDAAKIHINAKVFAQCGRAGLLPGMVPSKMTWLMQPLDIRGFFPFKMVLQKEYQACRIRAAGGVVSVADWLACVCAAIRTVLQGRCWASAFDAAGFSPNQAGVSERTRAILGMDPALHVGAAQPTLDQLGLCFPKRSKVPSKAIWKACEVAPKFVGVVPRAKAKAVAVLPPPPPPVGHPLGPRRAPMAPPPCAPGLRRSPRLAPPKAAGAPAFAKAVPPLAPAPRPSSR
jgi:hypothetical protein